MWSFFPEELELEFFFGSYLALEATDKLCRKIIWIYFGFMNHPSV